MNEFFTIIGLIFSVVGIIAIFDARPLSKNKIFKDKQNKTVMILKISGFIIFIIGAILIYSFFINI